jgi:hypothetical protein
MLFAGFVPCSINMAASATLREAYHTIYSISDILLSPRTVQRTPYSATNQLDRPWASLDLVVGESEVIGTVYQDATRNLRGRLVPYRMRGESLPHASLQ